MDKKEILILTGAMVLVFALLVMAGLSGMDKSYDNQNEMLCNSAKVSGNEDYLKKCQPFYKSGDIKSVRGM